LAETTEKGCIDGETEGDFTDNFNVKHWQKCFSHFQPLLLLSSRYHGEKKSHVFYYCWPVIEEKHPIINPTSIDDLVANYLFFSKARR
jgi:hypothetical protein